MAHGCHTLAILQGTFYSWSVKSWQQPVYLSTRKCFILQKKAIHYTIPSLVNDKLFCFPQRRTLFCSNNILLDKRTSGQGHPFSIPLRQAICAQCLDWILDCETGWLFVMMRLAVWIMFNAIDLGVDGRFVLRISGGFFKAKIYFVTAST